MMPMSLADIATVTGGRLVPSDPADAARSADIIIDGPVVTDSRLAGPRGLYVARVGEHADGHRFVGDAADAGAVAALTSRAVSEVPCVVVDDVQVAFGRLARAVVDRAQHGPNGLLVVAVTGSSGKTSTKDLLAQVLTEIGPTVAPENSLNGEVGVPLTVCRITSDTRVLVAEMGARGIGHIAYLTRIAPPRIGVVLNVGTAHIGEFGSQAAIVQAKGELIEALPRDGVAILNADDPAVAAMADRTGARVVLVGESAAAHVRAVDVRLDESGRPSFRVETPEGAADVALALHGRHHVGNALAVLAVAMAAGMPLQRAVAALGRCQPLSRWRMEVTDRPDGVRIVNDAYNANPDSMRAALQALAVMAGGGPAGRRRTWAVLGEMFELGEDSQVAHARVGEMAAHCVDVVVAVGAGAGARALARSARSTGAGAGAGAAVGAGAASAAVEAGAGAGTTAAGAGQGTAHPSRPEVHEVPDTDTAYALISADCRPGDVVLLKSSNAAGLRWLGDRLAGRDVKA